MKTKFNHIKGSDNLFMHNTCDLYLLKGSTNWIRFTHFRQMMTNKRMNKKQLEIILASVCRRCFDGAIEKLAEEGVLPQIEI